MGLTIEDLSPEVIDICLDKNEKAIRDAGFIVVEPSEKLKEVQAVVDLAEHSISGLLDD